MPTYPKEFYARFTPKPDITRDEVIRLFDGTLIAIGECEGFSIVIDDSVSLEYALNFLTRLIRFIWADSDGVFGIPDYVVETYGSMMRHFDVIDIVEIGPLE